MASEEIGPLSLASESTTLVLYADLLSQPCRAVLLFLRANNIPHVVKPPSARRGHLSKVQDPARINLVQLVPEITDNGFYLSESFAILKYLCSKYELTDQWYPDDVQLRACIDEFCVWCSSNIHLPASYIYIHQILDPKIRNIPVDRDRLRRHKNDLDRALDKIERRFLSANGRDRLSSEGSESEDTVFEDTPREPTPGSVFSPQATTSMFSPPQATTRYVCGAQMTIADVIAVCELTQPIAAGYDVLEDRPRLSNWFGVVRERFGGDFEFVNGPLQHTRDVRLRMIYQCSSFDVDY